MIPEGEVADDTIAALIGSLISERGQTRIVYAVAGDDDWVIKESRSDSHASNVNEWKVWTELHGTEMADLFAECRAVSTSRRYLIMRRLEPEIGNAPKPALPDWLTDRKVSGLGLAPDGSVKVLDYGLVNGEPGKRADAPLRPWPSPAAIIDMANIMAMLDGDDDDSV
jgi:hypothetical protein